MDVNVGRRQVLGLGAAAIAMAATGPARAQGALVAIAQGELQGVQRNGVNVFLGIPYARPPVGELRWRAPQPPQPWAGLRQATAFGPASLQPASPRASEAPLAAMARSEDCLTLNLWVPPDRQAPPRPVMVWLHGGGFRLGSGGQPDYDGAALAAQGAIVVTLNYRLGVLGVFAHPALRRDDEPGGNFGLLDAIAALRWVQANIAAFGGDPGAVTLFGESAGGAMVAYLTASPLARGLFARAIIQSGAIDLPDPPRAEAAAQARAFAAKLGANTADALRALPADVLASADIARNAVMPFVDGDIVRRPSREAFERGEAAPIPLLIGTNDDEAGFFPPPFWNGMAMRLGPEAWARARALCSPAARADDDLAQRQIATERFVGVNTRAIARAASRQAPVHLYRFAFVPQNRRATVPGAIHTAEIPYVFGAIARDATADDASRAVSRMMSARWIAFASGAADWPAFDEASGERMLLIGDDRTEIAGYNLNPLLDDLDSIPGFHVY